MVIVSCSANDGNVAHDSVTPVTILMAPHSISHPVAAKKPATTG